MPSTVLMMRCDRRADLELAQELHQRGHVVYATALQVRTVGQLQAIGVRVDAVNLGDWDTVKEFMARLKSDNAMVDVVINNVDLGSLRVPLSADELRQQFDIDMVAAFAILNLFGFTSGPLKRIVNIIRAPDWSSIGLGSPLNANRKLLVKLCQSQRETLGTFGVEVAALQVSGAPAASGPGKKEQDANAEAVHAFQQRLADAILAVGLPALSTLGADAFLPAMLGIRPKLVA